MSNNYVEMARENLRGEADYDWREVGKGLLLEVEVLRGKVDRVIAACAKNTYEWDTASASTVLRDVRAALTPKEQGNG